MGEDAFDRALQREEELRDKLASGQVDEEQLRAMREFADAANTDVRLTLDQARRLVEEGADPTVVAEIVRHFHRVGVDEAIDLAIDYGLETSSVLDLVSAGAPRDLDASSLTQIYDNDIGPDLIELVHSAGFDDAVGVALELTNRVCDPTDLLQSVRRAGLADLTLEQICTIADYEINPEVLRRLLAGDPELDVDGALRLLGAEPHADNSISWTMGSDLAIDAMKVSVQVARGVARAVAAGLKGRSA